MTESADKRPVGRPSEGKAVYVLRDERGAIRYVGVTRKPAQRLAQHVREARSRLYRRHHWIMGMVERGHRPTLEVVEWADDWAEAEPRWIAKLRAEGCDLVNGNDGGADMRQTERGPRSPAYKTFQRRLAEFQARAEPEAAARIADLRRRMREQHRALGSAASEAIWRSLLPEWMHVPAA